MKLQCACGAKYAFDITPEMAQNPVRFVCPQCGQDSSDFVNELVRREFGEPAAAPPPPPAPAATAAPRLRISHAETPPAPVEETLEESRNCSKHPGVRATEKCTVCRKPICPQCLDLFGYFCSPLCKGKAEAQNIQAPVFAGGRHAAEAKFWRNTGLISGTLATLIVLFFAGWIWYAWFGAVPHPVFSVRFDQISHTGGSQLVGKDQIVFLHGGTLGRVDLKTKKTVWSLELVTPAQVADAIKMEDDRIAKENAEGGSRFGAGILPARREKMVRLGLEGELSLHVAGENIWLSKGDQLTRYDWDSGKVLREITLPESGGELVPNGDELLLLGGQTVTHISLASGDTRTEDFPDPNAPATAVAQNSSGGTRAAASGGLPFVQGGNNGQPLDPSKVAAQAQNLKLPARIALPALLANAAHEQQLEAALKDDPQHFHSPITQQLRQDAESFELVRGTNGFVQFSTKLLEEHLVTRSAMKAAPAKSALNGEVNASKTTEIANEILNEMQRNNGGDVVTEDESRYSATVHLPGTTSASDWTGEVIGPPHLFPLKTVNVVAGGKTVIVLDQTNKKLWQAALTYPISGGGDSQFGAGPCVERGDTLYVFDQAVLTAFDLATGNARWRLPSIGVVGLFFDDQGMIYVNTTTGNPDDLKYSRQIDINKSTAAVVLKIDPANGKTLWSVKPGGLVSYLSGKFIYTVESYDPGDAEDALSDTMAGLHTRGFLRTSRINPKHGRLMWVYQDDRAPMNTEFHNNIIELVFKKEVQVLEYLSF
jgi:hypothetical protein